MSDATKLATLKLFKWERVGVANPTINAPIDADDTTLTFSSPPKDETGTIITGDFLGGMTNSDSYTETYYVPAGGMSGDGLTATGVIRGIDPAGLDYTVGNSDFAASFVQGDPTYCNVNAVYMTMMRAAIQGSIATNGLVFTIGDETNSTVTIQQARDGSIVGWLRKLESSGKVQFMNQGGAWINIDDVSASDLIKISAADTTPGYGEDKIRAGANIIITKKDAGGNEYLEIESESATHVDVAYTAEEDITVGAPVSKTSVADEVENTIKSILSDAGTESTFEASQTTNIRSTYVSDNKVAAIYVASNKWYIIVGTVANDKTIAWGTAVEVSADAISSGSAGMVYIEDDKIAIHYVESSTYDLYVAIVTISGTVPTLGTPSLVHNSVSRAFGHVDITLADTDKLIVAYSDSDDASKGKAKCAIFTDTTIGTWGSAEEFEAGTTKWISLSKFDTDKVGVFYTDQDDTNKGKGALLIATGTSLAANTPVEIDANTSTYFSSAQITTDKIIVAWNGAATNDCQARVATLSGLTISYGTVDVVNAEEVAYVSVAIIDSGTAFVTYEEISDSDGKFNQLEISGTGVTAGTQYEINGSTGDVLNTSIAKVSGKDKFIICYRDEADSNEGHAEVFQLYDNIDKSIGFAQSTVSATESVDIRSAGIDTNQTSLTTGTVYYVKSGGIESTNNSGIKAGVAKTTTSIDIDIDRVGQSGDAGYNTETDSDTNTTNIKDTTIVLDFRPSLIEVEFQILGRDGANKYSAGKAVFNGTTGKYYIVYYDEGAAANQAMLGAVPLDGYTGVDAGATTAENCETTFVGVQSISATGFVLRTTMQHGVTNPSTGTVFYGWKAFR